MSAPLAGRTALVTGASRGIGAASARALAAAGARVALVSRSEKDLARLASEIGGDAAVIVADLGDRDAARTAAQRALEELKGAPDILINNAGIFEVSPISSMSSDTLERTLDVNLVAPFQLLRALLPAMIERGSGHIVTIGSIADRNPYAHNAAYSASKYGIRAVHEVLRVETRGTGVRATLVSPGAVDTALWDKLPTADKGGGYPARKQMLPVSSVADAVLFVVTREPEVNIDELRLTRA